MKFKKTYILLMILSLFLLVSIGSVCAEDISADADIQSTDEESVDISADDTNNILAEESETPNVAEPQEKINTSINTIQDEYKFSENEDKNISVEVEDNESQPLSISKDNLTVFEGTKSLNFTYNGSDIALTDNFTVGAHNITINYLGNLNYANSSKIILLKIFGERSLELDDTTIINGTSIEIPVKVFDGVDYLDVTKDDFGVTLTYTNSTGNRSSEQISNFRVEDGKIKFDYANLSKLIAATVTVNYTNGTSINGTTSLKFATRVNSSDAKINENADKNITVSILSNNTSLAITKNDLRVLENGKDIAFEYNNSIIKITSLAKGVHTLTIVYKGNDTYCTSNATITVKVFGNQTFNPDTTVNLDSNKNVTITLNLSDGADPVNVNVSKLNITLFYKVGNVTYNRTIPIADITLLNDDQTITFKVEDTFDSAYVDIKYAAETNLTARTTLKMGTNITTPDSMSSAGGKVINFTIQVKSVNGTLINVTVNNTKIYKDGKEINFAYNNSVVTLSDTFTYGVYNITVKYLGTDTYSEVAKSFILTVYGINATSSVDVNSTKKGEKGIKISIIDGNETVNFTKDDLTINVTAKNGNDTVQIALNWALENGNITFNLSNVDFTTATLTIKYNDTEFNVTLNRIYNVRIEAINLKNEYLDGEFKFKLVDVDDESTPVKGKEVSLMLKGNISVGHSVKTDDNGIASFKNANLYTFDQSFQMKRLEVGIHPIDVSTKGDVHSTKLTTNLTVTKANIKIVIDPYKEYWGSTKKVKITATYVKSGNAVSGTILDIYMPKTTQKHYYVQTNSNGIAEIGASGLSSGNFEITVSNNDTTNFKKASTKSTLKVLQKPVSVKVSVGNLYYNSGSTVTIKMTNKLTGKAAAGVYFLVQIDKGSKAYLIQTDKKGQFTFTYYFSVGKHSIAVATYDSKYVGNTVTKTFTVKKASATIKAPKVTDYYKGGKYFTIKLVNSKTKKPIYAGKLNVKIFINKNQYYKYDGKTGLNGQIRLLLDNLKPQKYKVEITGTDNKNFVAKKVTSKIVIKKAPTKLTPKKLKAKKGAKKYFKVKVTNKKTKKVIKGVKLKIKVYTGKKAKTFTAKSNSKGIAKILTKKLKVGKHKVVVTSDDKYCVAKKAKSKITIKK